MNKTIEFVPENERCQFCGKRATLLCDMPHAKVVRHARGVGFSSFTMTCDKRMCTDCTTRVNGFDFCPDCVREIKIAKKGVAEHE